MELYSLKFVLFLLLALIMYYSVFRKKQWICLLIANMVFYAWSGLENLLFIFITALTTFCGGVLLARLEDKYQLVKRNQAIDKAERKEYKKKIDKKKRIVLFSFLALNFGILAYLKYWNTILDNISILLGEQNNVLSSLHTADLILPLGISFYIFMATGYLIDIYGGKYEHEKNFFQFLLFISFFPQIIQGPINRFDKMAQQFKEQHKLDYDNIREALFKIMFGAMKKYAIANLLVGSVALILDNPTEDMPGSVIVFGIILYSVQMYADFSGGMDMVFGIGQLFGIRMMQNFRQPYFATSLAEFWRRWHISLGAWMRDYIFYPLTLTKTMQKFGKRIGKKLGKKMGVVIPVCFANIIVFLVVGLWHGAQWHYIFWGLYNGIIVSLGDLFSPIFAKCICHFKININSWAFKIFQMLRTFIIVCIGRYFDRIEDISDCLLCFRNTITNFKIEEFSGTVTELFASINTKAYYVALFALVIVFINSVLEEKEINVFKKIISSPIILRWGIYYCIIFLILLSFTFTFAANAGGFLYANY